MQYNEQKIKFDALPPQQRSTIASQEYGLGVNPFVYVSSNLGGNFGRKYRKRAMWRDVTVATNVVYGLF